MSLSVHTFRYDADGGHDFLDDPENGAELAGFESTRKRLWGGEDAVALGARFLPRLARGDLYVERDDVADFLAECAALRPHLGELAVRGGYLPDYVRERFANIVAAAERARAVGGGIVIW
ncbi:hypothetical protein [Streptomyces sp. NRRL F-5123]|uniref:hypothetical protein n=1 Tax=Streptomyces sp. NRRL F-5123 TaxID=1463856 RepID=UPI0004E0E867|nr:hypothetical protein [Streptomyces sp. NRRL F-5123]